MSTIKHKNNCNVNRVSADSPGCSAARCGWLAAQSLAEDNYPFIWKKKSQM